MSEELWSVGAPIPVARRCPDLGLCSPELGQQHQTAPEGQGLALATPGTAEWPLWLRRSLPQQLAGVTSCSRKSPFSPCPVLIFS